MLDLSWALKRHTAVFSGAQRFAQERGWTLTVDEFARDTLLVRSSKSVPYDGIIARATKPLAEQTNHRLTRLPPHVDIPQNPIPPKALATLPIPVLVIVPGLDRCLEERHLPAVYRRWILPNCGRHTARSAFLQWLVHFLDLWGPLIGGPLGLGRTG